MVPIGTETIPYALVTVRQDLNCNKTEITLYRTLEFSNAMELKLYEGPMIGLYVPVRFATFMTSIDADFVGDTSDFRNDLYSKIWHLAKGVTVKYTHRARVDEAVVRAFGGIHAIQKVEDLLQEGAQRLEERLKLEGITQALKSPVLKT